MSDLEGRRSSRQRKDHSLPLIVDPTKVGEVPVEIPKLLSGWKKGEVEYKSILPSASQPEVPRVELLGFGGKEKVQFTALEHDKRIGDLAGAIVSQSKKLRASQAENRDCREQVEKLQKKLDSLIRAELDRCKASHPGRDVKSGTVHLVNSMTGAKLATWKLREKIPSNALRALVEGLANGGITLVIELDWIELRSPINH